MFTKKQIEEIAAKLAEIAIKDSQFDSVTIPLNGSESVPVLQSSENRILTLADLRSLVLADQDQQAIKCILTVSCSTSGATIQIKGHNQSSYVTTSSYMAYYGEVVDVKISADGYDTWYEVITMTQNHTVSVALNKSDGGSPGPTPVVTTYYVKITNSQSARITVNGNQVASGSMNYFEAGERVEIYVTKDGYQAWSHVIPSINENYPKDVTLPKSEDDPESPYIKFSKDTVTLPSIGASGSANILSNISWEIDGGEARTPEQDAETDEPSINDSEVLTTYNMIVGESVDLD